MVDENKLFHASRQMRREDIREFDKNVPPSVSEAIANDHLGKPVAFPTTPSETPGHTKFSEPTPLGPPPGIALMDKMMEVENALWRRELAQRLGVKAPKDEPPSA